jgi:hypothetical protein
MRWPQWLRLGARRSYDDRVGGPDVERWSAVDADTELNWRTALSDFNERVWPLFREQGISKDAALQVWILTRIENAVDHIERHVCDASCEDEAG